MHAGCVAASAQEMPGPEKPPFAPAAERQPGDPDDVPRRTLCFRESTSRALIQLRSVIFPETAATLLLFTWWSETARRGKDTSRAAPVVCE